MNRISVLAVQLRKSLAKPRGALVEGCLPGLPARPENASEGVWLTEQRLWRLLEKRKQLDKEVVRNAFAQYDANDNGVLELCEIRAMLLDLGLYPATTKEKAVVREALAEIAALGQHGTASDVGRPSVERTVSSEPSGEGAADEPVGLQRRAALQRDARHSGLDGLVREWHTNNPRTTSRRASSRRSSSTATSEDEGGEAQEERAARTAFLTPETVGGFVSKVRTGLMMCRQEGVNDLFQRYDLFNSGVLDLNTVFDILADRKLMPKEWELQRFLCETFVDEGAEPGKQVSFRGWEHFKRRHAAVPISCQEFLHLFHFLQQSDEQSASETEWAEAKRYGIADVRLYMALREEVAALHRALRRYGTAGASPPRSPRATEDAGASYDKNEVWVALNTLGLIPPGMDKAKILKVVKKGCTHGELKTGSTSGLTALGSRLIEGWGSSKSAARMSFEDFLRVVVRVRELVRREESFHLRPVFARHCTPAAVGRLASGAPGALDTRTIDTAGIFRALHDLGISPTDRREQDSFRGMLDDANEFGLDPLALDFTDFSSLVRRAREWVRREKHARVAEDAQIEFQLEDWQVNEYRTAFDALDREGTGRLPVSLVPTLCKVFGWGEEPAPQQEKARAPPSRAGGAAEAATATIDFGGLLREAARQLEAKRRSERVFMNRGKLDVELQSVLRSHIADVEDATKHRELLTM